MIKLSKLTDYAVVVLAEMARADETAHQRTAADLAESTGLPEPTVAKVLKLLAKGDVITSIRGVNGGYRLDATPDALSIAAVIAAVDGPIALTACVDGGDGCCAYEGNCAVKRKWDPVNAAMKSALENVTLAQMMAR